MASVEQFLAYWQAKKPTSAGTTSDEAKRLYTAYRAAEAQLADLKSKGTLYIIPIQGSEGLPYHPGYDPDHADAISTLATEIDQKRARLKAFEQAITSFLEITEGSPELKPLSDQANRCLNVISRAEQAAHVVRRRAMKKHPEASLEDLSKDPEVVKAEEQLAQAKEMQQPIIEDLEDRLKRCYAIIAQVS